MRITATDEYAIHKMMGHCTKIGMSDFCERMYCKTHRSLWMSCETSLRTRDGAGETFYEIMDCPECMTEGRIKKYEKFLKESV